MDSALSGSSASVAWRPSQGCSACGRPRAESESQQAAAGNPLALRYILPPDEADPRTLRRYENKFRTECEPQIAARQGVGDYMLGSAFTAVDVIMGHIVFWATGYGLCRGDAFRAYIERLMTRPALQKALDDLGGFELEPAKDALVRQRFTG